MTLRSWEIALRVVALALVFALGTAWFGWWTVPVLAFVYGVIDRGVHRRGTIASVGVILGWGGMLLAGARGAGWAAAEKAASVVGAPLAALAVITLIFGVLLASCASIVGAALSRAVRPKSIQG